MHALLLKEYNRFEFVEFQSPSMAADEVLIRVATCGICGSDVHGFDGSTGRRIPPLIMGHEAAGTVEQTGAGVPGFTPGGRVTFDSTVHCGECFFCRRGEVNLCDHRRLADDWGPHGITVNCLAPGWFKTAQNAALYENKEWVEYLVDRIPLKRPGQPTDLDGAIVLLASEASEYVTGQTLLVDGGISTGATRATVAKKAQT